MTTVQGNIERDSTFAQDWGDWHAAREFGLTAPRGWLSLTAFHWLPPLPGPLDGLPGTWSATDQAATYLPPVGDPVTARVPEAGSVNWIELDERVVELVLRGGRYAVRVRDPKAPTRTGFVGVPTYEVDQDWVVPGRFAAFDAVRSVTVDTPRPELQQQVSIIGTVTLQLAGVEYPLQAGSGADGSLSIIFHDDTNGAGTAPWRSVATSAPDADGKLTVDFNRAVNMPFAFSDYGTCPAPPAGNRIPLAVTAGERAPR